MVNEAPQDPAGLVERLELEIDRLRQQLSEARRAVLPTPVPDYTFRSIIGEPVTLRSLFNERRDLLVVHNMGKECAYCTLWADGFNGLLKHIAHRTSFAIASPDAPEVMGAFAASRGWQATMVSEAGTTFRADMGFEPFPGEVLPGVSAFCLDASGQIYRSAKATFGPLDDFCPVWPLFDLLPDGTGNWQPKFVYP